ncbi:hypothetical protein [Candidatus Bealeia paramacronuclearis]
MKKLFLLGVLSCGFISESCQSSSKHIKMKFEDVKPEEKTASKKQKVWKVTSSEKEEVTAVTSHQGEKQEDDAYKEGDINPFNEIFGKIKGEIAAHFSTQLTYKVFHNLNLKGNWQQLFSYAKISELLKNANDQIVGIQSEKTALEDDYKNAKSAYMQHDDEKVVIIMSRYPNVSTMTEFYKKYDEESRKFNDMENDLKNAIGVLERRKEKMEKDIQKQMTQNHFLQKLKNHPEAHFNTDTKTGRSRVTALLKDIYGID